MLPELEKEKMRIKGRFIQSPTRAFRAVRASIPGMHRTPNSGRELRSELIQVEASRATEWGAAGVVGAEPHRLSQGFPEFDAPKIRHILGNF